MATINEMRQVATQIENATIVGENSAQRVGGLFNDIVDELEEVDSIGPLDNVPTADSQKGAKSGGIYSTTAGIGGARNDIDLEIADESSRVLAEFKDGHLRTKNFDSRDVASMSEVMSELPVIVDEDREGDFSVADENGFSIVRFQNGHIMTKYFNSEKIQNSAYLKFDGKKFAIIGDSISTYNGWLPSDITGYDGATYAVYYPHGNVNAASKTWWYRAIEKLGITPSKDTVNVCAWSASRVTGDSASTTSAYAACSNRRVSDVSIRGWNPDIILIFISCNDWAGDKAVGTWQVSEPVPSDGIIDDMRSAYAIMLNKLHVSYPMARIFCCTILDDFRRDRVEGWPSNNASGISTAQWNQNIKEIADAFGCDIIDMHACGINYSNIASLAVDEGLHPNATGMEMMAQKVASELLSKY